MTSLVMKLLIAITVLYLLFVSFIGLDNYILFVAGILKWIHVILWIVVLGGMIYRYRDKIKRYILGIKMGWKTKFFIMAVLLALIEEGIVTSLTNSVTLFGLKIGDVPFTASSNFIDVIAFHSVVAFIPMFIAWIWLLKRYEFSAKNVFLLFGLSGWIIEIIAFGPSLWNIVGIGFWIFVYGLMLYLPAYTIPSLQKRKMPGVIGYILAVLLPLLASIPVALLINLIHPIKIHF